MCVINVDLILTLMLLPSSAFSYVEMERDLCLNVMMATLMMAMVVVWIAGYSLVIYAEGAHQIQMIVV